MRRKPWTWAILVAVSVWAAAPPMAESQPGRQPPSSYRSGSGGQRPTPSGSGVRPSGQSTPLGRNARPPGTTGNLGRQGALGRPSSAPVRRVGAANAASSQAAHGAITHDLFRGHTIDARPFSANQNRNPLLAVRIQNGDRTREALFKPREWGDGDGWNRTPMEYVAYVVNRMLGMDYVPPVAYRRGFEANWQRHSEGALLYRVPGARNLRGVPQSEWGVRSDLFLSDARVLDVLLQNPDRHPGNFLIGEHWVDGARRPVLIDHAACLRPGTNTRMNQPGAMGGAPLVVRQSTLEALRALNAGVLRRQVGEFVSNDEIRGILERRDGIVGYFENLVSERGADRVVIDRVDFAPPGALGR